MQDGRVYNQRYLKTVTPLTKVLLDAGATGAGATETRAGAGYPIRFAAKWLEALSDNGGLSNPERSKSLSKANADQLFQFLFARQLAPALRLRDQ